MFRRRGLLVVGALFGALVGCSEAGLAGDEANFQDSGIDDGDDTSAADTGTSDDTAQPAYWAVQGSLAITGGTLDTAASSFTVSFYDTNAREIDCQETPPIVDAVAATPPDAEIFTWWTFTVLADSELCGAAIPPTFGLGLGALDSRLEPALAADGYDPATLDAYGLYLQASAELPVWVFGVAGTAGNFDGSEPTVAAAPLPDGVYALDGLHLLPLQTGL